MSVAEILKPETAPAFLPAVIIDARKARMSLDEMLSSPGESREQATRDNNLWIVNAAITPGSALKSSFSKAFCSIQPYSTIDRENANREKFVSAQAPDAQILALMEIIGSKAEVGAVVINMLQADQVTVNWLSEKA